MAIRWEYTHIVFKIHNTDQGRQWCWQNGRDFYVLSDALDYYGDLGWELVSLNPEVYAQSEARGTQSASFQRAVFKRPL